MSDSELSLCPLGSSDEEWAASNVITKDSAEHDQLKATSTYRKFSSSNDIGKFVQISDDKVGRKRADTNPCDGNESDLSLCPLKSSDDKMVGNNFSEKIAVSTLRQCTSQSLSSGSLEGRRREVLANITVSRRASEALHYSTDIKLRRRKQSKTICTTRRYTSGLKSLYEDGPESKRQRTVGYKCIHCHEILSSLFDFEKHMATHGDYSPYKCSYCPKQYKHARNHKYHVDSVHKNVTYRCTEDPQCNVEYKARRSLKLHIRRVHHGVNERHVCMGCHKTFSYKRTLIVHRNTVCNGKDTL